MEAFEYAIKKDVRNNPIVREVDEARQRQLLRSVWIFAVLVAVVLFSTVQHFQMLRHGYDLQKLQLSLAAEQEANRRLRLDVERLKSPARIEAIATKQLHMVSPTLDQTIVIERVTPAAAPDKSIVAAR